MFGEDHCAQSKITIPIQNGLCHIKAVTTLGSSYRTIDLRSAYHSHGSICVICLINIIMLNILLKKSEIKGRHLL